MWFSSAAVAAALPGIRAHLKRAISDVYGGMDVSLETFPADNTTDAHSYIEALGSFKKGDAVTIFTPDDTHFEIALECVKRGLHVLVTKPIVKTLEQHKQLYQLAMMNRVLVAVEVERDDRILITIVPRVSSL